jgi:hypothetical protein
MVASGLALVYNLPNTTHDLILDRYRSCPLGDTTFWLRLAPRC